MKRIEWKQIELQKTFVDTENRCLALEDHVSFYNKELSMTKTKQNSTFTNSQWNHLRKLYSKVNRLPWTSFWFPHENT